MKNLFKDFFFLLYQNFSGHVLSIRCLTLTLKMRLQKAELGKGLHESVLQIDSFVAVSFNSISRLNDLSEYLCRLSNPKYFCMDK